MPTTSISPKFWTAARNTMRPMRPKPLMPILMAMGTCSWMSKKISTRVQCGLDRRDDVLDREPEVLEEDRRRRRFAVAVDADDRGAAVLPPAVADAHLDGNARHAGRKELALVGVALAIEDGRARHRDDAHCDAAVLRFG